MFKTFNAEVSKPQRQPGDFFKEITGHSITPEMTVTDIDTIAAKALGQKDIPLEEIHGDFIPSTDVLEHADNAGIRKKWLDWWP